MDIVWKYRCLSLTIAVLVLCSVSVKSESEPKEIDKDRLNLLLSPKLNQALTDLLNTSPADTPSGSVSVSRRKRFAPSPTRVDSKVSKLKTPKSEDDGDVPVIRGLGGLSPVELRLLNRQENQDDGQLIRTTTQKSSTRTDKSLMHKKKDDGDVPVPVISGTKDLNHPSREEARNAGKSTEDNTVVLLNGATAQRVDVSSAPPPHSPSSLPPPRPLGRKARCQQRKLLLQLDEQLAVLRKLNEQRDADIARSMSWVEGAGRADADYLRRSVQQVPNVPIPYIPYVSNLPIYGRSDWVPLPLQPSYEYQVSGNTGPPIAGIYRRTWVPPPVPADAIDCEYEDDRNQPNRDGISTPPPNNFQQRPGFDSRPLHNSGEYASTPAPVYQRPGFDSRPPNGYSFQRPGFEGRPLNNPNGYTSTPTPNSFQRPGFDGRPINNPNGYASTPPPNFFQRPGYVGRPLNNPNGYASTSPPNSFQRPGFDGRPQGGYVSTAPNSFQRPGFDLSLRPTGGYGYGYGGGQTPGTLRRDDYGRAYVPVAPKIEVDDKLAKPKDDPAEDEEQE